MVKNAERIFRAKGVVQVVENLPSKCKALSLKKKKKGRKKEGRKEGGREGGMQEEFSELPVSIK
jgi:hypothetical protein